MNVTAAARIIDREMRSAPQPEAISKAVEALEACAELFMEIRMDWTDPRSECREGMEICESALSALRLSQPPTRTK